MVDGRGDRHHTRTHARRLPAYGHFGSSGSQGDGAVTIKLTHYQILCAISFKDGRGRPRTCTVPTPIAGTVSRGGNVRPLLLCRSQPRNGVAARLGTADL